MNERIYEYSAGNFVGKTKIIYGCFQKAREFAVRLLCEEISFDLFLLPERNEDYFLPRIFNKPVIDVKQCMELSNAVILVSVWEYEEAKEVLGKFGLEGLLEKVEELSAVIRSSEHVIVYGTGGCAKRFYSGSKQCLTVQNFCDSNESRKGEKFFGIEIINPSDLASSPDGTVVLIASTYLEDIYHTVLENGISEECIFVVCSDSVLKLEETGVAFENYRIQEWDLHAIVRDTKEKQMVIYGYGDTVKAVLPKLKILGISPEEVVLRNNRMEDGTIYNLSFLYKKGTVVLMADLYSVDTHTALTEIGVTENDMVWLWGYSSFYASDKHEICCVALDPSCGHTYLLEKEEYPSFITYSYRNPKSEKRPMRLLTLGGSTTSAYGVKTSSWSQKLSLLLKEHGISHVLYCGGIDAYTTGNELVKLIRDGIWLKPDIVISYTGCNNANRYQYENLFLSFYQETLFKSLARRGVDIAGDVHRVYYGIHPDVNVYEYWYTQVKMFHGVCDSLGIRHKVFLQPLLFQKKTCYPSDADIAILWNALFHKGLGEYVGIDAPVQYQSILQNAKLFAEKGMESGDTWFESLTDMFEKEDNVYMDYCHVYEKGNQIIAENIFQRIEEELQIIVGEIGEKNS